VWHFGLKENGLELAQNETNREHFTKERLEVLEAFAKKIVSGEIEVPADD
jgi:basic membrane lipoprotein Med (substrate-binding protein (PBP1-ABC) superfamily)